MAVDLRQLGKLLALTRSSETEEAASAEEVFTNLFFKWCDEQGLPENVGFVRVGDVTDIGKFFLETLAGPTGARVLQLNAFDLCAVGTLAECRALAWWFENALPEIIETSHKSAYGERDGFQAGACLGMRDELASRQKPAVPKVWSPPTVATAPKETPEEAAVPSEPVAVKLPTPKEHEAMRAGHLFGRNLARRNAARSPYPL